MLSGGGGASQGMVPAAARASGQGLGTGEAPHRRHSPAGLPGASRWGWMRGELIACRNRVLVESLSSHQEKSRGSRSADCGVAEMVERSCPDLLQDFAGTRP